MTDSKVRLEVRIFVDFEVRKISSFDHNQHILHYVSQWIYGKGYNVLPRLQECPAKTIIHMHYKAFASGPYANSCDGAEQ